MIILEAQTQLHQFVLLFNNIFDIFNSRTRLTKYKFKRPIIFRYFEEVKEYILGLTLNGIPIVKSARKTACINSIISIYNTYLC